MKPDSKTEPGPPESRILLLVLLAVLPLSLASNLPSEKASNRFDGRIDELLSKTAASPAGPRALLDVIDVIRLWDVASPGRVEKAVDSLASMKKLHPQARMLLGGVKTAELTHRGDFEKAAELTRKGGLIQSWLVLGPFDNEDRKGQEREMGPELDIGEPFALSLAYEGDERAVNWRPADADPLNGVLYLSRYLYPDVKVCGYAGTYMESPKDESILLWGTSSGTLTLWVDGTRVVHDGVYRSFGPMRHAAQVKLSKGSHQVLAKVCIDSGDWKLAVQLTTPKAKPAARSVNPDVASLKKPYAKPAKALTWSPFETALSRLEADAQDPENAEAAGDYARLLLLTGSDDTQNKRAQDFAQKASEATGSCGHLLTLALTTDDDNRSLQALKKCLISEPGNADANYLFLTRLRNILDFPDYAGEVSWRAKKFEDDPLIQLMRVELLEDSGMPIKAMAEMNGLAARFGPLPVIMEGLVGLAPFGATQKEGEALLAEALAQRSDNLFFRSERLRMLLKKGDHEGARKELELLLAYFSSSEDIVDTAVSEYIAMTDMKRAEEILQAETERSPHNPQVWQDLGIFYNMTGDGQLALTCFQTVLELNPQNVEVRQYIANLMPEEKFEKAYIKDDAFLRALEKKLKAEGDKEGDLFATENTDLTVLVEQEVDRVYENGTASRFIQESIRINTDQGGKIQRYQIISYSPTRQDLKILRASVLHPDGSVEDATGRFTIPIVEEQYRLYYDDANEIIEMPSLAPGDIVDLQYKLSDTEVRNMWERHFGNAVALTGLYPKIYFRYEIIADRTISLFFDTPALLGLKHKKKDKKDTVLYSWEASDIPPVLPEPEMPPLPEIASLIRVSTFETWQEFGKWWWALASQQMVMDKNIREKVAELVKGKKSDEEKISAIFDWVIRSTRYVGLEFGIHGFKPYRTTEVVARGFGDCKDKATLLYVMLKEAGIDAAIALVRTRGSGEVNPDFPFQFLFDHAIAAVPSLDLFLDGTVDYLDFKTLPPGDQGVFSLVLSEGKIETPSLSTSP
jgi:tetratricopeptide (TPR) repeat protein